VVPNLKKNSSVVAARASVRAALDAIMAVRRAMHFEKGCSVYCSTASATSWYEIVTNICGAVSKATVFLTLALSRAFNLIPSTMVVCDMGMQLLIPTLKNPGNATRSRAVMQI